MVPALLNQFIHDIFMLVKIEQASCAATNNDGLRLMTFFICMVNFSTNDMLEFLHTCMSPVVLHNYHNSVSKNRLFSY